MRYIKVILSSLVLFSVYMWIAVMLNSCNNKEASPVVQDDPYMEDPAADPYGEFEGDFEGEGDTYTEETETVTEYEAEPGDYTAPPSEEPKPKATTTKTTSKPKITSSNSNANSGGNYLVIAGSYLIEDNANSMVQKLNNKGFNAEIVHFDYSQYHSICAGRYDSRSTAENTASSLKGMGIDAYVHTRQ